MRLKGQVMIRMALSLDWTGFHFDLVLLIGLRLANIPFLCLYDFVTNVCFV